VTNQPLRRNWTVLQHEIWKNAEIWVSQHGVSAWLLCNRKHQGAQKVYVYQQISFVYQQTDVV
jgi:hypothetical protein